MFTSQHVNDNVLQAPALICWMVPERDPAEDVPVEPHAIILPPVVTCTS